MVCRFHVLTLSLALAVPALLATGCSNSNGDDGTGTVSVVLTDGATDELSQFEVDVSNVVLTKLDGATVSVMPRTSRVDFVQLESLGELVAAVDLPAGVYSRLDMTLDFAAAEVVIAGETTPATVRDASGAPLTGPIDVRVELTQGSRLVIRPLRNNLLALDLDLDQSVSVDAVANVVTFVPVLGVDVDPTNDRAICASGFVHSVSAAASTFEVERRDAGGAALGTYTVVTFPTTVFQLGGVVQVGAPGLGSLIAHIGQRVFVQGTLQVGSRELRAVAVETGAGVPGNGQDWVLGHVVARSGGAGVDAVLTVLGRSFDVDTGARTYNRPHTVNVSHANSKVLRRGGGNSLDSDAIGIGQLVWVFGDLTGTTLDATSTTGVARLLHTAIVGTVVSEPANETVTLAVQRFDHRDVSHFDFTVSGVAQADPASFPVDVTGLSTSGLTTGSHVLALGWIAAVGSSGAEATADALVDRTNAGKVLFCLWLPPAANAITVGDQLELTGVDDAIIKVVGDGIAPWTLTASPTPTVQALAASGVYRIVQNHQVVVFGNFPAYRTELALRLATANVLAISGLGTFVTSTQAFSALAATVVLD